MTNETNLHRAARLTQANSDLTYQQARALLVRTNARPRTAGDVAALIEISATSGDARERASNTGLDRGLYMREGRCSTCRSWVGDIGPTGSCYPCDALAAGELTSCGVCGWWLPVASVGEPCENCGWMPVLSERLTDCVRSGEHLLDHDDDGYCNACGHQEPVQP